MNFKEAVEALYEGKKIRHKDWPSRCYAQIENEYGLFDVSPNTEFIGLCYGDDPTADDYVIYDEPVLTDIEHDWLLNVSKSFMNEIVTITKRPDGQNKEFISILTVVNMGDGKKADLVYRETNFPSFPKGKFYAGMELGKPYTHEDLDLI